MTSQHLSEQWQQFDQGIRDGNRAAIRTIKALVAARAEENDILDGRTVLRAEEAS